MIVNLMMKGTHTVNINENRIIKVGDKMINVDKDVPIMRYRFEQYTDKEISYIKNMMDKLTRVTHLAEIPLNENTITVVKELPRMAKFVYSEITSDEADKGEISADKKNLLMQLKEVIEDVDRIVFKDKTRTMDTVTYSSIVSNIAKNMGIHADKFGICESPLSFGENCCLTAVKAREIMSKYSEISDVALPSANHQNMNCCGCVRFIVIDSDTEMVEAKVKKEHKEHKESTGENKTEHKKSSVPKKGSIQLGRFSL